MLIKVYFMYQLILFTHRIFSFTLFYESVILKETLITSIMLG